jgi:magnesium-transporting ATPase (P-type)
MVTKTLNNVREKSKLQYSRFSSEILLQTVVIFFFFVLMYMMELNQHNHKFRHGFGSASPRVTEEIAALELCHIFFCPFCFKILLQNLVGHETVVRCFWCSLVYKLLLCHFSVSYRQKFDVRNDGIFAIG